MCGIIAVLAKDSNSIVENALGKIKHRGLDATKILSIDNITIGFNRLAINDKSEKGMQPFEYKHLVGVFNGEIYNANELIQENELITKSTSDIEVILPLFEKIGASIIYELDGFYSGIIFNKKTQQIYFLRDYIGKKPLFYGTSNKFDFITSELKAFDNIKEFQIIPKGCSTLIDGELIIIKNHNIKKEGKDYLKHHLIQAVKKRIPNSEEKIGVFLSGGLDSSIIASIASQFHENIIYYTLGNSHAPDLSNARLVAEYLGIEKDIKEINLPSANELPSLIDNLVYHTESYNPSIISNGLATYLLAKAAHEDGLKVILSGEGADELFCGYPISKNIDNWFSKRNELVENLHTTELRRLDLSSMAHTIEIRCPFLDRNVFASSLDCTKNDLIKKKDGTLEGKQFLRESFIADLPLSIIERKKTSFDVGSGIRKLVVEYLTSTGKKEKEVLKEIWLEYYQGNLSLNPYFHVYPTFDEAISKRGIKHK